MASDQTQLYGDITGKRIKRCRTNLGLTQKDLAGKINVTPATINKYETGITPIPRKRLQDIAEALSVSPIYLLGFTDDPDFKAIPHTPSDKLQFGIDIDSSLEPISTTGENFMNTAIVEGPKFAGGGPAPELVSIEEPVDSFTRSKVLQMNVNDEELELLRIYRILSVRRRMQLLNYAYNLEDEEK